MCALFTRPWIKPFVMSHTFTGVSMRSRFGVNAIIVGNVGISIFRFSKRDNLEKSILTYVKSLKEWSYEIHSIEFTDTMWKRRSYITITIVHNLSVVDKILNMVNAITALNLIEKKAEGIWTAMDKMKTIRDAYSDAEKQKEEDHDAYLQSFYEDDEEETWTKEDQQVADAQRHMREFGVTPPETPLSW